MTTSKQEPWPGFERRLSSQAKQVGQATDDGEPEPQPLGAVSLGIPKLDEFLEDVGLLILRNADAGVPDLDRDRIPAPAAADQDTPAVGVARRIGDEVAEDAVDQRRIGVDDRGAAHP